MIGYGLYHFGRVNIYMRTREHPADVEPKQLDGGLRARGKVTQVARHSADCTPGGRQASPLTGCGAHKSRSGGNRIDHADPGGGGWAAISHGYGVEEAP